MPTASAASLREGRTTLAPECHVPKVPTPAATATAGRVPALDAVRGLAALAVLAYHFAPETFPDAATAALLGPARLGWVGVDLFFALSGYLITGVLLDTKGRAGAGRAFYARRALRIFPLYYATLFAVFVALPLAAWALGFGPARLSRLGEAYEHYRYLFANQAGFWLYLANVPGVVDPSRFWYFMSHFWSLAVEEHFYLVWPLAVWRLTPRRLAWACVGLAAGSLALRVLAVASGDLFFPYIFTPMRLDGLAAGSLLAVLARRGGVRRLVGPAKALGAASTAALAVGFVASGTPLYYSPFASTVGYTLLAAAFGSLLVLVLAASGAPSPPPSPLTAAGRCRALGVRVLRFFGTYSYAVYVFNRFLEFPCDRLFPAARLGAWLGSPLLGALAHLILGTAVTTGCAVASWHLFEKHFLKLKDHFRPGPVAVTRSEPRAR